MSSRQLRRLREELSKPSNADDSDEDYSPQPNHRSAPYAGLIVSDDSDTVLAPESEEENEPVASTSQGGARRKKIQQKKVKNKKRKTKHGSADSSSFDFSSTLEELDEIDRSVREVNAILGMPPTPPPEPQVLEPTPTAMTIEAKCLNVNVELKRLFGPEDPEEVRSKMKSQPHRPRVLKRVLVAPHLLTKIYDYKRTGLSMSVARQCDDVTYFVYDHDEELQRRHLKFLEYYCKSYNLVSQSLHSNLHTYTKNMHVEPLLQIIDRLLSIEEYTFANELIENVVVYLQHVAHPSFNLTRTNVRLSYVYKENRPFHVVMLKYAYLLSNKACHRTALEIAKMLLNADPSDPLAVVFIIDTLALRAREHEWLIEAVHHFIEERQANLLFNIQYSYAVALFHVALKKGNDFSEADKYIQYAILTYPIVFLIILECCSINDPIKKHILFDETKLEDTPRNEDLNELMFIYAKLAWSRYREQEVMQWLLRNAREITQKYDNDESIRAKASEMAAFRDRVFLGWPAEIVRHMYILAPMAPLILEMPIDTRRPISCAWDPLLDIGIDRYGYKASSDPPSRNNVSLGGRALLYSFFTSMIPNTNLGPPANN